MVMVDVPPERVIVVPHEADCLKVVTEKAELTSIFCPQPLISIVPTVIVFDEPTVTLPATFNVPLAPNVMNVLLKFAVNAAPPT